MVPPLQNHLPRYRAAPGNHKPPSRRRQNSPCRRLIPGGGQIHDLHKHTTQKKKASGKMEKSRIQLHRLAVGLSPDCIYPFAEGDLSS